MKKNAEERMMRELKKSVAERLFDAGKISRQQLNRMLKEAEEYVVTRRVQTVRIDPKIFTVGQSESQARREHDEGPRPGDEALRARGAVT
jgi:hypothetical protein